jgi:hypothetical protein
MIRREETLRVGLKAIRAQFKPSVFKILYAVNIEAAYRPVRVRLLREPSKSCKGGLRVWLECPSCLRRTVVVGLVGETWGCQRCFRWHGRNLPKSLRGKVRIPAPMPMAAVGAG